MNYRGLRAFEISAYDAFIFSTITGSQYLDHCDFPFTSKGLMKLFQSNLSSKMVTGLWAGTIPHYSPRNLIKDRPFLAEGIKYLLPIAFQSETEFRREIEKVAELQLVPGQILVHRIESSKEGCGQESLLEYLACEYFRSNGYLVDNQIPLAQKFGSPDWMAISPACFSTDKGIFAGRYLFEYGMNSIQGWRPNETAKIVEPLDRNMLVGEVKVENVKPKKQVEKYLASGIFSHAVITSTDSLSSKLPEYDSFFFDSNWKTIFSQSEVISRAQNKVEAEQFQNFVLTMIKMFHLSNFSNEYIQEMLRSPVALNELELKDFLHFVEEFDLAKALDI